MLSRPLRGEKGGAMLELAVAVPIILLMAIGVGDYARVYFTGITVANAALAGAHYGAPYNGNTDSMNAAAQRDAGSITLDTITSGRFCRCPDVGVVDCVTGDCGAYGVPQVYDSVRVRKDVALIIRYLGLPQTVTLIRTSILRAQ